MGGAAGAAAAGEGGRPPRPRRPRRRREREGEARGEGELHCFGLVWFDFLFLFFFSFRGWVEWILRAWPLNFPQSF